MGANLSWFALAIFIVEENGFCKFCCDFVDKPPTNPHYTACKVNRPGNEANFKMQYNA